MKQSFLAGNISTSVKSISSISTEINLRDFLGAVMVRWGINRNNFSLIFHCNEFYRFINLYLIFGC
jgi:hypothetical protein